MTTKEIKAALKTIREQAASKGMIVNTTKSRRGVRPLVMIAPVTSPRDITVYNIDSALVATK